MTFRTAMRINPTTECMLAWCLGVSIIVAMVGGCGQQRPRRVPVSGRVLLDGKPLTFGVVRFLPPESRPSTGKLDDHGRFALSCFEPGDGAVPGTHAVEVIAGENLSETECRWHAPARYARWDTSGLVQEVTGPATDVVIELSGNEAVDGPSPSRAGVE